MKVRINGEPREFPDSPMPLEELLLSLGLEPRTLLVEHNGSALTRAEWKGRLIANGDSLELLRISAGG